MANPHHRLYRTKFALLATTSMLVGLLLLAAAALAATYPRWEWLSDLPVNDLGLGLFATGLFGVLFEYVGRRDAENESIERIRNVIAEDLAAKPDGLVSMLSSDMRDRIIGNCLAMQLGEPGLAKDVYADLRSQVIRSPERRHDMTISVALTPWSKGPGTGPGSMFVATIHQEYRVTGAPPIMRFMCVSSLAEYRELRQDPTAGDVWYFEPIGDLTASSPETYELLQFNVNGTARPLRRTKRADSQVYTVSIGEHDAEVVVSYTYRVLVQRNSHTIALGISRPTKALKIALWYGNCGIRYVYPLDFVAAAQPSRVTETPANEPTPSIELAFDGWIFPKAGVAFVWVLADEMADLRRKA